MASENKQIWSEQFRLAVLSREQVVRLALVAVMVGLGYVLFHLQGNTMDIKAYGRSAVLWMLARWQDPAAFGGIDYSHGFLIPLVSIGVIWWKRRALAEAPKRVNGWGLAVVVLALLLHWVAAKSQQPRLSLFCIILLFWGVPLYFYGWPVAKILVFPCAYLIFCIPLNFLDSLTFPLRLFSTVIATSALNGLGIAAERSGSAIYSAAAGGFSFDVADPCSGIRSLIAMTALTAAYAYITQKTLLKKWLLFLASVPLAIIGNIARVVSIALIAEAFGEDAAMTLYHDYSGYVVFTVAIGLMVGFGRLLNINYRQAWEEWKQVHLSPRSEKPAPPVMERAKNGHSYV